MTYVPRDLAAMRVYMQRQTGLAGNALGIAPDDEHLDTGGYHVGNDDLARAARLTSDYSKRESGRDRPGSNAASADDTGTDWPKGGAARSRRFDAFLVERCRAKDLRTRDIREIIYSPDGRVVHRYDALGIRSTGDSSHRWHTHKSYFRDSEDRRDNPRSVFGLYLEFFEGVTTDPTTGGLSMQMMIKASDSPQIWLADGMFRRPVPPEWVPAVGNGQTHASGYLGNLGNNGQVFVTGPTAVLDVWGIDIQTAIASRVAELAAADAARDVAARNAIDALTKALAAGGGNVETAAILARMDELALKESRTVQDLVDQVNDLRRQLAAADRASADTWTSGPTT
jgi:hypothetical protein